ncbi:HAD family hydrolase [Sporosarcina limicola]|uniref:HAD superfamily hydrolase (TIGR01490 family) n=1 Tax=Sporosarcina limicola TaxID=34101 RepID=A0A927MJQ3_9BACL|nr:HAD-IB family hydrolase [Sporosarcina limicola]MBE1554217.1 HAD superfamily hydrolase (TIGR01490 family) [Sporosarcina limicola]
MRVAIVDFDGTLYAEETFQLLMRHLRYHPVHHPKYKRFYRSIIPPFIGYKLKLLPEAKMKARSMQVYLDALQKLTEEELNSYFEEMAEEVRKGFNQDVLSRIEQHIADDVHVMLVSGAYTPLLQSVTKGLQFDMIIGTDIPFNGDTIDRRTPIYHIQGPRKNEKIQEALDGKEIDWENSFAYGDSFSDLSVLELVGNPVAVRPEPRLQTIAEERKWDII